MIETAGFFLLENYLEEKYKPDTVVDLYNYRGLEDLFFPIWKRPDDVDSEMIEKGSLPDTLH